MPLTRWTAARTGCCVCRGGCWRRGAWRPCLRMSVCFSGAWHHGSGVQQPQHAVSLCAQTGQSALLWSECNAGMVVCLSMVQLHWRLPFVALQTATCAVNPFMSCGTANIYLREQRSGGTPVLGQGSGECSRLARTGHLFVCFGQCVSADSSICL
jgi:hypothetical protein